MKTEPLVLRVTHRYSQSPERVFDAWLDPGKAGRFLFATPTSEMVRVEIDPRVGGSFVFVDRRDGEDVEHVGEYLEIDRPRRLVFNLSVPKYSPEVDRIALDFAPHGTGCELVLTHEMQPTWENELDKIEHGWVTILDKLDETLA